MLPGPKYIYKCPTCENLLSRRSLQSGNTFLSKLYSDGKNISPMLPEFPSITICSKCKTIFWIDKAEEIGSFDFNDSVNDEWRIAEEVRFLTIDEYFKAIDNKLFSTQEEELFLRVRNWWTFNDRVRNQEELFQTENEKGRWLTNVNRLLEIIDYDNFSGRITIAELNRNLGNFDNCMKIISSVESSDLNWVKPLFEKECDIKNNRVFLLRE